MTQLRIDMNKFKAACQVARKEFDDLLAGLWTAEELQAQTFGWKREVYRENHEFSTTNFSTVPLYLQQPAPRRPATYAEILAEIQNAARAAMQYGASDRQVEYLAHLAFEAGDWSGLGQGRLSRRDASLLIAQHEKDAKADDENVEWEK